MTDFYSGLIAGIISNTICNPFDVIRSNQQLKQPVEFTVRFLYRGIFSGLITIPTFWSIYFESYNKFKQINHKLSFLNGYIASNIASTITCPLWFIRQKNQTSFNFNFIKYYNKHGIYPFYNALTSTYIINSSFIIQIPLYENLRNNMIINNSIKNDTFKIFLITTFSKTIATCFFYPFDTIRTIKRNRYDKSIISIIYDLNKYPLNYYRGLNIYLLRCIPYHSVTFCTYEYVKKLNFLKN